MPTPASCPVTASRKTIAQPLCVGISLNAHKNNPVTPVMAAGNAVEHLQEEITCAICLDFFHDPVMILSCGHNFCRRCLERCSADASRAGSCPQCRLPFPHGGFRPNRQLANVVAAVQELAMPAAEELCQRHHQPLTLFSRRDGRLLCTTCAEHRAHPAVPLEEAACWYRDQFEASLKALQEEDERRAGLAAAAEETRQEMLSRVDAEKQKLLAVLEGLRRVLGEQESRFLIRLGRLRLRLEEQRRGEAAEMARLQQRRSELQAKCRQPDSDLLRDAQITLSRCTEWRAQPSLPLMPELEAELEDFALKTNMLAEAVMQFKDIVGCSLEEDSGGYRRATVTLDPATAHPQILVSADGRTAGRRESPLAPLPSGTERFESLRCVLGLQGFSGGRHRWAVEVRPGPDWALGVAREFMSRKGCFGLSPERGVWAVGQWLGQLRALTWPSPTSLPHSRVPRRIEVALDYAGGRVAFRDADSETEIFAFPPATFAGERLRPLLWLGEGPALLTLCP
ncbi:E3 ubiquitin-protein ligase TRIM11-like isoform X1 [Falco rusticolus]|uniref:E3 ubiquitin-protein ligase TRIM11-like isoform X1 n=2 Tax=Falco TaxID=8952 RepID=UPI001886A1E3|nr:E3 ubiquitin-protein ligase TRIM11-like isoform X1 [Falco rusticolus]XP_055553872.1 E3 ubiquitin-protein ligase TRIM11-like isoform X1 [Falco cherrug]